MWLLGFAFRAIVISLFSVSSVRNSVLQRSLLWTSVTVSELTSVTSVTDHEIDHDKTADGDVTGD